MKENQTEKVNELFICECSDVRHQIIMSYYGDEEFREVFCSIHLIPERNLLKRIRNAVMYIFGYRCAYGDFEEFIFNPEDADRLQTVVDYLREKDDIENR